MPTWIPLVLALLEEAIKVAPDLAKDLQDLFKTNPSPADWQAMRDKAAKSYTDYVPDTRLPREAKPAGFTQGVTGKP